MTPMLKGELKTRADPYKQKWQTTFSQETSVPHVRHGYLSKWEDLPKGGSPVDFPSNQCERITFKTADTHMCSLRGSP